MTSFRQPGSERSDHSYIAWAAPNLLWLIPAYAIGVVLSSVILQAVDPWYEGVLVVDIVGALTLGLGPALLYVLPAFAFMLVLWRARSRLQPARRRLAAAALAPIVMAPIIWLSFRFPLGTAPGAAPEDPAGPWRALVGYALIPVVLGLLVRLPPPAGRGIHSPS